MTFIAMQAYANWYMVLNCICMLFKTGIGNLRVANNLNQFWSPTAVCCDNCFFRLEGAVRISVCILKGRHNR